ncbi:hypothetical protein VOLCADRAFT_96877 [Volvox carteri f. nagariensis]|uniref:Uncharacterized protein n=1 Tax=Volvox carteri f. nagariensis TaxID=3068 RepID=D8UBJ1_VOLCA|nr:uncharacterized protein VOLCADRAFT_96877 [Volvox carteri f. nagariensis]EFJ42955.1 hypothetical protein VOLCADRAFT_96877 [Volvox carteri f. nagariensis]|eukprot:XP_002955995.1 hypothetical protein VOLCADRAFT_96877 [Volvox carteri f. nagariensis]
MTQISTSRVSPQAEALAASMKPSQPPPTTNWDADGMVNIISNGRIQGTYPSAKAWTSDAVPPGSSADLSAPATAVHYYRQRRDLDDAPDGAASAVATWLSTLLCMPRLGSGRAQGCRSGGSVDSVDFVSTWQKAQAEAAARRVVPVLKRASAPNTPEDSPSVRTEVATANGGGGTAAAQVSSPLPRIESKSGRSISFGAASQGPASCPVAPSCASSGDLVMFVSESLAQVAASGSRPDSRQTGKRSVRFN